MAAIEGDGASRAAGAAPLPFSRVLVTGGDGFVGGHVVPALRRRLAKDTQLVLGSRTPLPGPEGVRLDLLDPASVDAAVAAVRPDLIVHLAGQASVGLSAAAAADTWSINLGGSLFLARAIAATVPDSTTLFVSSAEVYGRAFNETKAGENAEPRPQSIYARSKLAAETMLSDVLPATARLIVVRPCNHSGRGQSEDYVIPALAAQIVRAERGGPRAIRVGNLEAERHFLDVRDVVAAYLSLLAAAEALPRRSLFNIASQEPVAISAILDRLRAMSGVETVVEQDPARMRPSEVKRAAIESSAIRAQTGWTPTHDLDDLLADVVAGLRTEA